MNKLDYITAAVNAGFEAIEDINVRNYNIIDTLENGSVEYNDPRINVVTQATVRFFGYYTTRNMSNTIDLATFGALVVAALDAYDE